VLPFDVNRRLPLAVALVPAHSTVLGGRADVWLGKIPGAVGGKVDLEAERHRDFVIRARRFLVRLRMREGSTHDGKPVSSMVANLKHANFDLFTASFVADISLPFFVPNMPSYSYKPSSWDILLGRKLLGLFNLFRDRREV
jgi:hypothetical protein